ncbi:hypothetical protein [Mesorhizobium sp. ANAO-SY3R2]|uniref:hypothetical protein n=1 Tax=Mesorhizobium sp. ANAO-SY3R2 TaxID=3166644 RepID=UPI00366F40A6
MLRTQMPHRLAGSDKPQAAARPGKPRTNDNARAIGQTEPFMFTRLFFVTGVLLGGLALASMLST